MTVRSKLYGTARTLGNVRAVQTGRVPARVARVAAGRAFGRGMRANGCLLLVLAVLLALALAACGGSGSKAPTTKTINGTFTLARGLDTGEYDSDNFVEYGGGCGGTGGYEDIDSGLQVRVSNEAGTVIGTGALGSSAVTPNGCTFTFSVPNLPVAKFYKVEVGNRGELSYSYEEMEAAGWKAEFTLG